MQAPVWALTAASAKVRQLWEPRDELDAVGAVFGYRTEHLVRRARVADRTWLDPIRCARRQSRDQLG
ncbi:hypothetical protein [Nocardia callitridis]|uniref:hypothetical protein n=1 Tax=Nocardia callitridis TaxID=648753 RepID=UPI0031F16B87